MNKILYLLLVIVISWNCTRSSKTEKYQNKRDRVINIREKVKGIEIKDVLIGAHAQIYLLGSYFIIADHNSPDNLIQIFDKNNFNYVTGITNKGKGPGEITILGHIAVDEANRKFYVTDHGKQCIFSYDLDSVLINPEYIPKVKMEMNESQFPDRYHYINDTLCMGKIIEPAGNSDFKTSVAKWNMITGKITPMKYAHPDIKKKRITFTVSAEYGIYVECFSHHDLMTICNLDGDLKYNIYGRNYDTQVSNRVHHYGIVAFCNDRIFASYSGGDNFSEEYYPTKFIVFDVNGDYLQTLETGYRIIDFCYDKEKNRIMMSLDDEVQVAYLDLDGLIE